MHTATLFVRLCTEMCRELVVAYWGREPFLTPGEKICVKRNAASGF
jgi:hypothetical protein